MSDISARHVPGRGRIRVSSEDTPGHCAFRCPKGRWLVAVDGTFTQGRSPLSVALDMPRQCDGPIR